MERSIRRQGSQLAVVFVLALIIAGHAGAAPPPTGPGTSGIQQYIETIPTATGGATSGSTPAQNTVSTPAQSSGGAPKQTSGGTPAQNSNGTPARSGGSASSGTDANPGTTVSAGGGPTTTSDATESTSDRGALKAVGQARGSGLSSATLLLIVLVATAIGAGVFGVIRRRRAS